MSRGKRNKIEDLRDHLFLALEKLHDGDMDVSTAKAVSDVAQTIINSAKVEIDFMNATGSITGSGFIPEHAPALEGETRPRIGWKRPA